MFVRAFAPGGGVVVVVAGGREQVQAAWLLKIGGSSVCFHVMGPEI